jgi:hypothetical protein
MGSLLLILTVAIAILVVPIMIAARLVGAEKTSFGSCLLTAFMMSVVSNLTDGMLQDKLLSFIVNTLLGAIVVMFVLDTSFLKGLCVSILATAIVFVVMLALAGTLIVSTT